MSPLLVRSLKTWRESNSAADTICDHQRTFIQYVECMSEYAANICCLSSNKSLETAFSRRIPLIPDECSALKIWLLLLMQRCPSRCHEMHDGLHALSRLTVINIYIFFAQKINLILFGNMSHNDGLSYLPVSMLVCLSVCQLAESFDLGQIQTY